MAEWTRETSRMQHAAPELMTRLLRLSPAEQRRVTRALVETAVRLNAITDPEVLGVLPHLDAPERASAGDRTLLGKRIDDWDALAFDAQDAAEHGHGDIEAYTRAVHRARTAAAALAALSLDPREAVCEAAYEAMLALARPIEPIIDATLAALTK